MLLEYFPIQSVVCYHDIFDTWPWSLQLTLSSRMSQVRTALDLQAGSYINCLRTMSQFRWSSHWTLTLSHWPAILEGTNVDGRKNGTPGTQITMMDYRTWFVLSLVLVGIVRSYVDLTRRRLHLFKFCKSTICYLSFQEVYKYCGLLDWLALSAQL